MASAAGRALPVVTDAERAVADLLPIEANPAVARRARERVPLRRLAALLAQGGRLLVETYSSEGAVRHPGDVAPEAPPSAREQPSRPALSLLGA